MIPFRCPTCKAELQANDTEAGAKFACPQCGQRILVPKAPAANKTVLGELSFTEPQAIQTQPTPRSAPPLPSLSGPGWYYEVEGRQRGPISEDEMLRMVRRGDLLPRDQVWSSGMADWRDADRCFDFPDEDYDDRPIYRDHRPRENSSGHTCSVLSCIFGAIAFLFCPLIFGITGIILGIVGVSQSQNKTLGIVGLVLSGLGLVVGMVIGIYVATALNMRW